jgi:hypothetical protein
MIINWILNHLIYDPVIHCVACIDDIDMISSKILIFHFVEFFWGKFAVLLRNGVFKNVSLVLVRHE